MKKIGIIAFILALIFWIISRVRSETANVMEVLEEDE
jgi:hypothetical protein